MKTKGGFLNLAAFNNKAYTVWCLSGFVTFLGLFTGTFSLHNFWILLTPVFMTSFNIYWYERDIYRYYAQHRLLFHFHRKCKFRLYSNICWIFGRPLWYEFQKNSIWYNVILDIHRCYQCHGPVYSYGGHHDICLAVRYHQEFSDRNNNILWVIFPPKHGFISSNDFPHEFRIWCLRQFDHCTHYGIWQDRRRWPP